MSKQLRLELPCPECRGSSIARCTQRSKAGETIRFRKCVNPECGHKFVVRGGPPLQRKGPVRGEPKPPRLTSGAPMLTQWRPYPFLETPRAVL